MRYFKFFFFHTKSSKFWRQWIGIRNSYAASVLEPHLASGQHRCIERAYDDELLYPVHSHLNSVLTGNLYFNCLVLFCCCLHLLYTHTHTHTIMSVWFYQLSDSTAHPTPWCEGMSCLAYLMTFGLNCSELFYNFFSSVII